MEDKAGSALFRLNKLEKKFPDGSGIYTVVVHMSCLRNEIRQIIKKNYGTIPYLNRNTRPVPLARLQ